MDEERDTVVQSVMEGRISAVPWGIFTSTVPRRLAILALVGALLPTTARAQLDSHGIYEVGVASTDLGSASGDPTLIYGVGAGATHGLGNVAGLPLVVGGDLVVRGFGLKIPDGVSLNVGVFEQTDVWLNEFLALRLGAFLAGVYLEHRHIDRSRAGTIGAPTTGIGAIVEAGDRTKLRLTYASTVNGRLRVDGVANEPDVSSGQSARLTLTHALTDRWSGRADLSYTNVVLESTLPTLSFFNHRQTSFTLGLAVGF